MNNFINDHNYVVTTSKTFILSHIPKEIIVYIAGFVAHKLSSTIHCKTCVSALSSLD